jgi:hypothetical protein
MLWSLNNSSTATEIAVKAILMRDQAMELVPALLLWRSMNARKRGRVGGTRTHHPLMLQNTQEHQSTATHRRRPTIDLHPIPQASNTPKGLLIQGPRRNARGSITIPLKR